MVYKIQDFPSVPTQIKKTLIKKIWINPTVSANIISFIFLKQYNKSDYGKN